MTKPPLHQQERLMTLAKRLNIGMTLADTDKAFLVTLAVQFPEWLVSVVSSPTIIRQRSM